MIKAVLFDLDGTLLPMDQDVFIKGYFKLLAERLIPHGYEKDTLVAGIWHSIAAMLANDGRRSNEDAFWEDFEKSFGDIARDGKRLFDEFYEIDFCKSKTLCGFNPKVPVIIKNLKSRGIRIALSTNPVFPAKATEQRIRWAGLEPDDFELYTTYETMRYCKPNLNYYRDVLKRMALDPEECLMVGNDVDEDMVAADLGIKVFLLTDCIINRKGQDISGIPNGSFDDLEIYIESLM